jgi:outer membrane protein
MKKTLLILSSCCVLALGASAAETQRIATIDLRKVFDNFWETKRADAKLKEDAGDLEKDRKIMVDQFQKNEEKYTKLLDSAKDPAISTTEREKRKKDAENELLGLRDMENRIKQFDATSRAQLAEKQRRIRDNLLTQIRDTVKANVKTAG